IASRSPPDPEGPALLGPPTTGRGATAPRRRRSTCSPRPGPRWPGGRRPASPPCPRAHPGGAGRGRAGARRAGAARPRGGRAARACLAMALGTAVSTAQAIRARRAVAAERAANAAAQAREAEMRAVLEFVEQRVFAAARPKGQEGGLGREVTLRQAIEAALPFVGEGLAGQPLVEARLRGTPGRALVVP